MSDPLITEAVNQRDHPLKDFVVGVRSITNKNLSRTATATKILFSLINTEIVRGQREQLI